jgi:charged multivesicular body protein 4
MNLFGKPKPKGPKITDSISQLREAMDTLEKREAHLQKQADEALAKAKLKSKKGDKKGALFELKRKKMFEKQIEGMFGKRVNLETQIMALQSAAANQDVLKAMKTGRDAIQAHISDKVVDEVADVMDQINENVSLIDEMDQALSQPVGNNLLDDVSCLFREVGLC